MFILLGIKALITAFKYLVESMPHRGTQY